MDVFLHDSEHTYENMMFEFKSVWPKLRATGLLLSDNIDWNSAFWEFSAQVKVRPIVVSGSLGCLRRL